MRFTVPNALSLLRMAIVPLFVIAVLERQPRLALLLFCVAGITDDMRVVAGFFALSPRNWTASGSFGTNWRILV